MKAEPATGTKEQASVEPFEALVIKLTWGSDTCNTTTDCGGSCVLAANHVGRCECVGDDPGQPGSCPA